MDNGVPIRSVSRSLSVLRTINRMGDLSLTDLARIEDLPYPTTFRIVQTLVHEGLIERENSGKRYRPTALVHSLSSGYNETHIKACAQPLMSALTRDIGWPILLSVRVGMHMVIRASTHAETTMTFFNWDAGNSMPLAGSATGFSWLAHLPDDHARDLVRWGVGPDGTGTAPQDVEVMRSSLRKVREQGYSWRPSVFDHENRTASIAVPVLSGDRIVCVLTLTYFAAAMKGQVAIERYAAKLTQTAELIGQMLAAKDS